MTIKTINLNLESSVNTPDQGNTTWSISKAKYTYSTVSHSLEYAVAFLVCLIVLMYTLYS